MCTALGKHGGYEYSVRPKRGETREKDVCTTKAEPSCLRVLFYT